MRQPCTASTASEPGELLRRGPAGQFVGEVPGVHGADAVDQAVDGPRLDPDDGRVISNYIKQALGGEPLTVFGDGSQTRSFQYVDDLVTAVCKVMFAPGLGGEVFNTGNPGEYTMLRTARLVKKLTRSKSPIVHRPLPQDDPTRRQPDISKIRRRLGWTPRVKFEEGLKRTIAWYLLHEIKA